MSEFPETRDSLLVQVRDPGNRDAWERFASIYRPVIVRIAVSRGLQHADAEDLSQQVLMAVAGAVGDWEQRDESIKFRHWLSRVTKNAILNALMRTPKDQAVGGSSIENLLQEIVDPDGATTELIETEYRRELYQRAAKTVRVEFRPESWQAFEMSVSGNVSIEEVAKAFGKSIGAIYTARSRIMFRLSELISELEEQNQ
ncbi:RNA polymerase sigma factor [Neorhodopirellula pilleata]|uniref:RNA polymerase sigma factor RpoE n=1 Tax=Neorhodopirellula pilleata TaxID=2714738 RepID=A0A5C6AWD7_9BACT|nr:sigma-70 family RNA polymerase sigma factor [Neorhodopirellula pilleata]TWU04060.1 RNA polymerase sigma factor RpoE [Neorhodopirellula pilleata]